MKHIKMLGLAVTMAAAFMAFAGSSSAATVTSPAGTEYTGSVESTASGSLLLKAGFANITCTSSTVTRSTTTNNEFHAAGPITTLDFSNCGPSTVVTLSTGSLTIQKGTRTVTGTNSEVTVAIHSLGASCVYGTGTGTDLGTVTSGTTTTDAALSINANLRLLHAEGFGCANPVNWAGTYKVTKPTPMIYD